MKRKLLFVISFTLLCLTATSQIRYVKVGGAGTKDGSSWANASDDLQAMITASVTGNEVWVASGTYKPNSINATNSTSTITSRDYAFVLKAGVKVYGGFNGSETQLVDRNVTANETILSGDIGNTEDISDNTYHVLIWPSTNTSAVIDGFTITGGNANGDSASSITVNTYLISRFSGGGMYSIRGKLTMNNLIFRENNSGANGDGAAIYLSTGTHPMTNIRFLNNEAVSGSAGAIYMIGTATINCNPVLTNVTFENNRAVSAGALYLSSYSNPVINNSQFLGNTATGSGGAIYTYGSSAAATPSVSLNNTIFFNNKSTSHGGVAYFSNNSTFIIKNITCYANEAGGNGGVFNVSTGTANGQIYNSIFYGNLADSRKDIYVFSTASTLSLRNSLFEDVSGNGGTDRANNIENGNPEFISINPSDANFLRLSANYPQSQAIDAGDNNFAAGTTDLAGNIRINNTTVDLGAYENLTVLPVDFISFNAKIKDNSALLNWTVASEKNNEYYTIERSADGKVFTPLERVPSKGNATSRTDYTFTDVNPLSGANYYRLSQTDYDGTMKELAVDYLNFGLSAAPSTIIYPNPTRTEFSIRFAGSKTDYISVNVSDLTGKLIFNKSLQIINDAATVNLGSNITPGNYIVSIKSGNAVERKVISIVP